MSDGQQVWTDGERVWTPETLVAQLEHALAQINQLERSPGSDTSEDLAAAYFARASALAFLDRWREALDAYDAVVEKFSHASDPAVLVIVCEALYDKAELLIATGDRAGAHLALGEIWRRFGDADDPRLQDEVLGARVRWAAAVVAGRGLLEGIALLDEILRDTPEVTSEAEHIRIAQALGNKAWALFQLGRLSDALATDTELLGRFGESAVPLIREQIAAALDRKAEALVGLGEYEKALDAIARLQENFARDWDPTIRASVADALLTRARILVYLRRYTEAAAELSRCQDDLSDANLGRRAAALEIEGTIRFEEGDPMSALRLYDQSIELAPEAEGHERSYVRALAVLHRAHALVKLRRKREARASLKSLVRELGGDADPAAQEILKRAKAALNRIGRI